MNNRPACSHNTRHTWHTHTHTHIRHDRNRVHIKHSRCVTYNNIPRSNLEGNPQLVGYTVFGKVIQGMDVVNRIKALPTGAMGPLPSDVPKPLVTIQSANIIKSTP